MTISRKKLERLSEEKFAEDRGEKLPPLPKEKRPKDAPKDFDAHPEDEMEIIDLKLDPKKIPELEKKDGYYPVYHMQRKHWITVALDDTVPDGEILDLIIESHRLCCEKGAKSPSKRRIPGQPLEWFVPANPRLYDIEAAFRAYEEINWKQSGKFEPGDIAYMYVGAPVSAILYKCVVTETYCGQYVNHKGKVCNIMRIRKVEEYPRDLLPWTDIKETGLGTAQGTKYIPPKLKELLEERTSNRRT